MDKDLKEMEKNVSGDDEWEINIDQLLEQADMLVDNEMVSPMSDHEEENVKEAVDTEVAKAVKPEEKLEIDSDMDDINNLLEQAGLNEKIDDDMLALLESATENQEDEAFDIFEDGDMPLGDLKISDVPEQVEAKDTEEEEDSKKGFRKKKKKKEKKEKKEKRSKKSSDKKSSDKDSESEDGEKKPGFFAKITALFGGDEDFEADEPDTATDNDIKILNELNGDKEKKSSKAAKKGGKKKENNKEKKGAKEAKQAKPKAKDKKPAAPKKKKEKTIEKSEEKSVKILNGKSFTAIAGLCLSIIAGVMIVTNFIPEYVDKKDARDAFRDGDYETVYQLFYDKKLSANEELLFNQSRVIRQMERRLEAYQNNITLGRELEAVDALMRGVENYQQLWEADEYQVRREVDSLYLQICEILNRNYGISQEEAVAIASYDKIEYTRALYAILGGNGVSLSGEEVFGEEESPRSNEGQDGSLPETESAGTEMGAESGDARQSGEELPEDILPEEEDILN